jgi:hypothetical protein
MFKSAALQRLAALEVTIFAESTAHNTPKARFKNKVPLFLF